jgi:uncharacterized protein (TIGR03437 family)
MSRIAILLLALAATFTSPGHCAGLSIPDQVSNAGDIIMAGISLVSGGDAVSALQFDLEWDPALTLQITLGPQIGASRKLLYTAPLSAHSMRVLIAGTDGGSIPDGEVVKLFAAADSPGLAQVRLLHGSAAGPDGASVLLDGATMTVVVGALTGGPRLLSQGVVNAGSLMPGPVAPGEIVTLLGAFGIDPAASAVSARVNGTDANVLYAAGNQINAVVPFSLDPAAPAQVEVRNRESRIAAVEVPVAPAAPALFSLSGAGTGPGAILNQDYTVNSPANPAAAGSIVMMYGTGFGALSPPNAADPNTGAPASTVLPVSATIAGSAADVTYAGAAPGLPDGATQINVRVPLEIVSNPAASISLSAGPIAIPAGITLAVR